MTIITEDSFDKDTEEKDPLDLEETISVNINESDVETVEKVVEEDIKEEDTETVNITQEDEDKSDITTLSFLSMDEVTDYFGESSTVEQTEPILIPATDKRPFDPRAETLPLPPLPDSGIGAIANQFPNIDFNNNKDILQWFYNLGQSAFFATNEDQFISRLKKEGSHFKQHVDFEGKRLGAGAVNLNSTPNDKLVGEKASLWVKSAIGMGSIIQIPLWHSGFWISIKSPSEIALLELNNRIAEEKITVGRATYGLAFSNSVVYTVHHLMNFILDHVFDNSIKDTNDIKKHIVAQDINILAWGMACAIWKNGFQYTRSIANKDGTIGNVIKALLAVPKMCITDNNALTQWQKSHMAGRHGRNMTLESIKRYRSEFVVGHARTVTLDEEKGIEVELSVPYLDHYINCGQRWITYLTDKVDQSMSLDKEDGRRDEHIQRFAKASLLRQYSHWVSKITVKGRTFEDTDTIDQLLDVFAEFDDARDIYFKEIGKFVDDTTVSLIGVPAVKGVDEVSRISRFPYIVPIDPVGVFFTLLEQKVRRIQAR